MLFATLTSLRVLFFFCLLSLAHLDLDFDDVWPSATNSGPRLPSLMLLQPAPLILLTGADGYVATEIALQCLHAGHRVRGTFRSSDKAAQWTRMQREQQQQPAGLWAKDAFEAVLAPDMVVANSFDHVLSDVDVVIHTASPVRPCVSLLLWALFDFFSATPRRSFPGLPQLQRPGSRDARASCQGHSEPAQRRQEVWTSSQTIHHDQVRGCSWAQGYSL